MNEQSVQVKARFDRTLVRQHHTSVRYLVVETTAPPPERRTEKMPPLNLGVVIDASGSMDAHDGGGLGPDMSRLESAQQASKGGPCILGQIYPSGQIAHLARGLSRGWGMGRRSV